MLSMRPHPVFRTGPKLIGATTLVGASVRPLTKFWAWRQAAEFTILLSPYIMKR
jgi:hypothetical protein